MTLRSGRRRNLDFINAIGGDSVKGWFGLPPATLYVVLSGCGKWGQAAGLKNQAFAPHSCLPVEKAVEKPREITG